MKYIPKWLGAILLWVRYWPTTLKRILFVFFGMCGVALTFVEVSGLPFGVWLFIILILGLVIVALIGGLWQLSKIVL